MIYKFNIPFEITSKQSLNGKKSWQAEHNVKKAIEESTQFAMKAAKLPHNPLEHVVKVAIYYNSNLDIDNHGRLAKGIIDGIRYYGLLEEDNKRHIRGLYQDFTDDPGINVYIEERLDMPIKLKQTRRKKTA